MLLISLFERLAAKVTENFPDFCVVHNVWCGVHKDVMLLINLVIPTLPIDFIPASQLNYLPAPSLSWRGSKL